MNVAPQLRHRRSPQVLRCLPNEHPQQRMTRVDVLYVRDGLEALIQDQMRLEKRITHTLEEIALLKAWDAALLRAPHRPQALR